MAADAWYREAVVTLADKGIITGYADSTFRPGQPITRSEFAAIAARFAKASTDKALSFPDVPANHWAFYDVVEASTKHSYTRHANTDEESWII